MSEDTMVPHLRWVGARPRTVRQRTITDVVVVALIGSLTGIVLRHTPASVHGEPWEVLAWVNGIGTSILVLFRHRIPWITLVVIATTAIIGTALRDPGPTYLYMVMALYTVVARGSRWSGIAVTAVICALVVPAGMIAGGTSMQPAIASLITGLALVLLGWLAGENSREGESYARRSAEQAAEAEAAAEADRAERTRRTIADERVLIARELHDIVAHTMSVIAVRAGVGRMVLDSQPEEAGEALGIIETTARSSLAEMRMMVSILRSEGAVKPYLGPLPGIDELERLIEQIETAGVLVDLDVQGTIRPLSAMADLTAYRIVQEALTNVVRHAGPTNAHVTITYSPEHLEIEVTDQGPKLGAMIDPGLTRGNSGHGIVGMQERAAMFGATLDATPYGSGYRVHTRLSIDAPVNKSAAAKALHG